MMKRTMVVTFVLALSMFASAAMAETLEGTLVDSKCYLMNSKNTTNDHMTAAGKIPNCGTACAKMGIPTGLLTSSGKYYSLAVPSMAVADYVGRTVRVSGKVVKGSVVVEKLEYKEGNTWKEAKIVTMM